MDRKTCYLTAIKVIEGRIVCTIWIDGVQTVRSVDKPSVYLMQAAATLLHEKKAGKPRPAVELDLSRELDV